MRRIYTTPQGGGQNGGLPGYPTMGTAPFSEQPPLRVTVSNCFINHCGIGVAVVAVVDVWIQIWEPIIINNTMADNVFVNVYNGSYGSGTGSPLFLPGGPGYNILRVANNIFMDVPPPFAVFGGMHEADMHVIRGSFNKNFNAYRSSAPPAPAVVPNLGNGIGWGTPPPPTVPEWPYPAVRTVNPGPPANPPLAPEVNLATYLGNSAFFINQLFAQSGNPRSLHDYRLAPFARVVTQPNSDMTGIANPMVNRGVTLDLTTSPPQILFASTKPLNGSTVNMLIDNNMEASGLPTEASDAYNTSTQHPAPMTVEPFQIFDSWDWDCNGFGNPRIYARPGFPTTSFGNIDLGAHELGDLLISGYLNDTRVFARGAPSPVPVRDRVYFFNVPGSTYPRPNYNLVLGGYPWNLQGSSLDWYVNAQTNPTAYPVTPASNFTLGDVPPGGGTPPSGISSWRFLMGSPPNQKQGLLVMRNLECDFSPHLLCDIHPLWATFGTPFMSVPPSPCPAPPNAIMWDMFASNGWHRDGTGIVPPPAQSGTYSHQRQPSNLGDPPPSQCDTRIHIDNPFLFYNPWPSTGWPGQTPAFPSNVTCGVLNPPGTSLKMAIPSDPLGGMPRLMAESFPVLGLFGPWSPCVNTSATTYSVDPMGIGDSSTGCPDQIPLPWFANGCGMRINCMLSVNPSTGIGMSNLQTFLMYVNQAQDAQAIMASPALQRPEVDRMRPTTATMEQRREGLRRLLTPPGSRQ